MSITKVMINLDDKLENRYDELIKIFDNKLSIKLISLKFLEIYNSLKPNIPLLNNLVSFLVNYNKDKIMYFDEIKYWSGCI